MHLNPLYHEIPELDPTKGGSLIGSSRDFVDPEKKDELGLVERISRAVSAFDGAISLTVRRSQNGFFGVEGNHL